MREVRIGHCVDVLRELEPESVQCVVTSPPYYGKRCYDGEQTAAWGGNPDCEHDWVSRRYYTERSAGKSGKEAFAEAGEANRERLKAARWRQDAVCTRCGAWLGAYGLEPTIDLYVQHTAEILQAIRRVLRPDGIVWWNLGDSRAGSGGAHAAHHRNPGVSNSWKRRGVPHWGALGQPGNYLAPKGLKPKDLCLIPFRVALAAQGLAVVCGAEILKAADLLGEARRLEDWSLVQIVEDLLRHWARVCLIAPETQWVRSVVIWSKPNPLPESTDDRPTDAHEYILLLAKSERYFYDADAVRQPYSEQTTWEPYVARHQKDTAGTLAQSPGNTKSRIWEKGPNPLGANLRSVWRFGTVGYPGNHFAVFPPELPRRCILAGTPPKVCATCATPWRRQTRREVDNTGYPGGPGGNYASKGRPPGGQEHADSSTLGKVARYRVTTLGWQPTCRCHGEPSTKTADCEACQGTGIEQAYPGEGPNTADRNKEPYAGNNPHLLRLEKQPTGELCPECDGTGKTTVEVWSQEVLEHWPTRPAIVLDPFAGSGTTLMVAEELGRWWIGIDICDEYQAQIKRRTAQRSLAGAFENATH